MKREIVFKKERFACDVSLAHVFKLVSFWMDTISNGEWVLELRRKTVQRGPSQNALLWVWMEAISKEWEEATGDCYTKEQWKEFFARKFLPVTGPDGEIVGGSTSGLTKEQMTEFLTKIHAYASTEWGITLLGSEDQMFSQWRSMYE